MDTLEKEKDGYLYFWHGIYSNWYAADFTDPLTKITFPTTEHAFMWYKANFFGDELTKVIIMSTNDPAAAKRAGRLIKNYNEKAWVMVRLGFMTYVNYLKFSQNPKLKEQIKDTKELVLVEASPFDKIWGIGLSVEDAANGKPWNGQNLLGFALMRVREEV